MKACFQIAECSLSYAKIVPASAMKACFQIAECSLSYAKIVNSLETGTISQRKMQDDQKS